MYRQIFRKWNVSENVLTFFKKFKNFQKHSDKFNKNRKLQILQTVISKNYEFSKLCKRILQKTEN